jgi:hypothetical protein
MQWKSKNILEHEFSYLIQLVDELWKECSMEAWKILTSLTCKLEKMLLMLGSMGFL